MTDLMHGEGLHLPPQHREPLRSDHIAHIGHHGVAEYFIDEAVVANIPRVGDVLQSNTVIVI